MRLTTPLLLWPAALALALTACKPSGPPEAKKATPPATVAKPAKEDALATLQLTPEAESRLGLVITPLARQKVERTRLFGGDVVLPPGARVTVSAPLAGTVVAPHNGAVPAPGEILKHGQPVFALIPLLTPLERARLAETLAAGFCRWARWSVWSPCWASPRATASC